MPIFVVVDGGTKFLGERSRSLVSWVTLDRVDPSEEVEHVESTVLGEEKTAQRSYAMPLWYKVLIGIVALIAAATCIPAVTQAPHAPGIHDFFPDAFFGQG